MELFPGVVVSKRMEPAVVEVVPEACSGSVWVLVVVVAVWVLVQVEEVVFAAGTGGAMMVYSTAGSAEVRCLMCLDSEPQEFPGSLPSDLLVPS
jgi:hypothetical protein